MCSASPFKRSHAFSLLEMMTALTILGIAATIAIPAYSSYLDRGKVSQAIADIATMQTTLQRFFSDNFRFPDTLAEAGLGNKLDPWGNAYGYLNFANVHGHAGQRKDGNDVPLNTDFDLYSVGKDGRSQASLRPKVSQDDVVRARDGSFIDLASKF